MSLVESGAPLAFHQAHGANIDLLDDRRRALRRSSYEKSLCFSHRPLRPNEPFVVTIEQVEGGWTGHLRVGLTLLDPSSLSPSTRLESLSTVDTWLVPISAWQLQGGGGNRLPTEVGSRVGVYLSPCSSSSGRLHLLLNDTDVVPSGIPPISTRTPLHAVVDVYGSTKEVRITPSLSSPDALSSLCTRRIRDLLSSSSSTVSPSILPHRLQALFLHLR
ncbi:hypothetical protein PENTCL1PPCAC_23580 [Pristionchus entomophagus]|uniref:NHR domain-containing protein n=1 Tax=Pristionchus entomophagus TaxID=358040 RepID=A0AAV5U3H0_9BILA|nr:hypothetical protein PENTCL1PPCAC_23580 [Pristionchus entomophagus]